MYAIVLTLRIAHTPRTHDRSFRLPFRPEGHARDTRTNNYNNTIHFVLRSRYILLLYTAIAERDGIVQCLPMCTYLYQCLFATAVGMGGGMDETEGNAAATSTDPLRSCVRQIYYPLYFMCFGFTFVREG